MSERVRGVTRFKLITRHQTINLINSRVCILVGNTVIIIFDYMAGFLSFEMAAGIKIAKEEANIARNVKIDSSVLCNMWLVL